MVNTPDFRFQILLFLCPIYKTYNINSITEITSIDCFHDPIMQHVLGGSLHKNNTSCLLLGLYHASVNWLSIVLMEILPQNELYYGIGEKSKLKREKKYNNT